MCNLNIFIKNRLMSETTTFLSSVSAISYISNSDSEGFYCDKLDNVVKSLDKIDFLKYKEQLDLSSYILIHERISTGGDGLENSHPFMNDEFVLIHNGIFNSFKDKNATNKSDTNCFFDRFTTKFKEFKENKDNNINRTNAIIKTIKELLDKNSESWSICVYDKIDDCVYYFKNENTTIHAYRNNNYIYLTTNYSNDKFLSLLGRKYDELEIKDNFIYKIKSTDKKIKIYSVGEIEKPKEVIKIYGGYNTYGSYDAYGNRDYSKNYHNISYTSPKNKDEWDELIRHDGDNWEDYLKDDDISQEQIQKGLKIEYKQKGGLCNFCGHETHNFSNIFGDYICPNCEDECYDEINKYGALGV